MSQENSRILREKKTVTAMVMLYCQERHQSSKGCPGCRDLLEYVFLRLEKCPFQQNKPTCAKCPVHCYNPSMREKIKMIMRYSGPRMIYRHPGLAIQHLFDGLKKPATTKTKSKP